MEWVKLGDVVEVQKGKKVSESEHNTGLRYIQIEDLRNDNNIKFTDQGNSVKVNADDVLLAWDGANAGISSYGLEGIIGSTLARIRVKEKYSNIIKSEYLGLFLQFNENYLRNTANGATIPHVNRGALLNLKLNAVNLEYQQKVITLMSNISNLISIRKTQIAALNELVQSVFYEMFGKYRILGSNSSSTKIKDIAEVISGATPKTSVPEYWDGDILWVTPAEINEDGIYLYDTNRKITEAGVGSAALKVIPENSVLLSSRAPIGKVAINKKKLYTNQGFKSIVPNGDYIMPIYLYFLLYFNTEYLNSLGNGATFKEISKKVVENISIPLPPLELQEQFAAKVEAIEAQKAKLQTSLEEMETLFDALMQEAFSGNLG